MAALGIFINFLENVLVFTNNSLLSMPSAKKSTKERKLNKKQKDGLKKGQNRMKRAAVEYHAGKYKTMQEAMKHVK